MKQWFIKHQLALIVTGIAIVVIGVTALFGWLMFSNKENAESEPYTPVGKYALLDLGSTSCTPCKRLQPILDELREEYNDKIDIVFYDIVSTQEGAAVANTYRVNIMPTLLFIDEYGNEVHRVIGFHTKEQIEEIFKELRWIE